MPSCTPPPISTHLSRIDKNELENLERVSDYSETYILCLKLFFPLPSYSQITLGSNSLPEKWLSQKSKRASFAQTHTRDISKKAKGSPIGNSLYKSCFSGNVGLRIKDSDLLI